MKQTFLITLLWASSFFTAHTKSCPSLTYNGKTYKTVLINTQCWMAENLNDNSHTTGNSSTYDDNNNVALTASEKECIANQYGRLYDWAAAIDIDSKISGWHLPTDAEWTTLSTYLGGESVAGGKMQPGGNSGFNVLFAGNQNSYGYSYDMGSYADIWSSSPDGSGNAWYRYVYRGDASLYRNNGNPNNRFSVRLVKD